MKILFWKCFFPKIFFKKKFEKILKKFYFFKFFFLQNCLFRSTLPLMWAVTINFVETPISRFFIFKFIFLVLTLKILWFFHRIHIFSYVWAGRNWDGNRSLVPNYRVLSRCVLIQVLNKTLSKFFWVIQILNYKMYTFFFIRTML